MHRIFQERPEILAPVFEVLGIALPEKATVDAIALTRWLIQSFTVTHAEDLFTAEA